MHQIEFDFAASQKAIMPSIWDEMPELTLRLREMWEQGYSARQISAAIGNNISRNSVIGRVHRIGAIRMGNIPPQPVERAPRKPKLVIPAEPTPPVIPHNISMLELTRQTCRYPYGDGPDYTFCGHKPMEMRVYCRQHCQIAFQPIRSHHRREA